jgi:hypothetical protein
VNPFQWARSIICWSIFNYKFWLLSIFKHNINTMT